MSELGFPSNPKNNDIYQANSEVVYQYSANKQCWCRISGVDNVKLASSSNAGLMSKEDFAKVENILLPSFSTTLSTEKCDATFNEGRVELVSTLSSLEINEKLKLFYPNGEFQENDFIIHDNTIGIDFRINIPQLIDELKKRGSFNVRNTPGDQGGVGDQGEPGEDRIDTGPVGEDGIPGANAPFFGSMIEDLNENLPTNKAVVDVVNDPNNPGKIIVTIGNIGNPGVGPKTVSWKDKNSQWIMGLSNDVFNCGVPSECAATGQLFHIDLQPILDKLNDRAEKILGDLKEEKETLANEYVSDLSSVFAQQRQAVCCALEAASSKRINQKIRNTWADGRYQAAQAGYAFKVTDTVSDPMPRTDPQQYPQQFIPKEPIGEPEQNVTVNGDVDISPVQFNCKECYAEVIMDRTNLGQSRSVKVDLPAFDYVATVSQCCVYHDGIGGTGVFNVTYVTEDGTDTSRLNDRGFISLSQRDIYIGDSLTFRHEGGQAEFFLDPVPSFGSSGSVSICVQPSTCFQSQACVSTNPIECDSDFFIVGSSPGKSVVHALGTNPTDVTAIYDFFDKNSTMNVYHPAFEDNDNLVGTTDSVVGAGFLTFPYQDLDEKGTQVLIVVKTDENNADFTYALGCSDSLTDIQFPELKTILSISHAEFYERGWRTKNCCGVHVDIDGTQFLVVYRSIGTDCNCGGGEYPNTPFIKDYIDAVGLQPALAWPTTDGLTFFGLPRGEDAFIEVGVDKTLANMITDKIKSGDIISSIGNAGIITTIAFPTL